MKLSHNLPWACVLALLLHTAPAPAQSLDQVPLEKRISILEDKVFLDFPGTALYKGEVPGVPFQPQNPHDYTTVMYYNGTDTLGVWAIHEFAFPKQDYLKEWLDPNKPGERNRQVLIDRDGLVAVLLSQHDYVTGSSGVFLHRLFVRTPDNLLFRFGVYLNNSALPRAAEYARFSVRILSTMQVGKSDKGLVARQEKLPIGASNQAMLFDLPARYHILAHQDRGIQTFMLRYYYSLDSAEKWHELVIDFNDRPHKLHEDADLSEKECKKVKGTLLGDKVTWLQFYKPDRYWAREYVMPFPSLGAGISMHVYMCTNDEKRLDELTRIAARIQLVERCGCYLAYDPMTMKKALFYIAAGGWVISLVVHLLALGGVDVQDSVPFVFLLHLGIFVVAIPTVILQKAKQSALPKTQRRFSLLAEFQHAPRAVKVLAAAGFVYAILNFGLFMTAYPGSPSIDDGEYVLMNHSTVIRTLTEAEYHLARAGELRGFSGHWIAFYGIFAAMLFPPRKGEAGVEGRPPADPA